MLRAILLLFPTYLMVVSTPAVNSICYDVCVCVCVYESAHPPTAAWYDEQWTMMSCLRNYIHPGTAA